MGLKDYVTKKTIEKIAGAASFIATVKTIEHMEKENAAESLTEKSKKTKSGNKETISQKSFFERTTTNKLIMIEKTFSVRKSFTIQDTSGQIVYYAKSEGLPKMPEIGLYDKDSNRIGNVQKSVFGSLNYTLSYKNKKIATLIPKHILKSKFEIAENGWTVEGALTRTTVYDDTGDVAARIQYTLASKKDTITIEYSNSSNEIPAVLIALAMVMFCHMQ